MGLTVPTVVTESVRSAPIRAPLQPVQGAGVDVSGLTQGLDIAGQAMEKAELQLSQIRISSAETDILNRWNARLNEDDDAYFKSGGQDAVERLDPSMQELDQIASEVMGGLKNGTERRILTDALALRRMNNRTKMSLHSFDSRQEWDENTALGNRAAQIESAINDPSPENLRLSRERVIDETNAISKIHHLPPEAAEVNAAMAVSGMYKKVIDNLIAQQRPFEAMEAFARYGPAGTDEILGDDETELTASLAEMTIAVQSSALALEARNSSDNAKEQLAHARNKFGNNPNPQEIAVIEAATAKVTAQRSQEETADGIANKENYDYLGEQIMAALRVPGASRGIELIEGLRSTHRERFDDLSTSQRASLLALAGAGTPKQTTPEGMAVRAEILDLAALNPAELKRINTDEEGNRSFAYDSGNYRTILNDSDWKEVDKAIRDAKGAGITSGTSYLQSQQTTLNERAGQAGIDLTVPADDLSAVAITLQRETQQRVSDFEWLQGRKPLAPEYDDILDRVFMKVLLPDNRTRPELFSVFAPIQQALFESGAADPVLAFKLELKNIPASHREELRKAFFNVRGRFPNENEEIDFYVDILSRRGSREKLLGKGR
jgi:hypothetical protein